MIDLPAKTQYIYVSKLKAALKQAVEIELKTELLNGVLPTDDDSIKDAIIAKAQLKAVKRLYEQANMDFNTEYAEMREQAKYSTKLDLVKDIVEAQKQIEMHNEFKSEEVKLAAPSLNNNATKMISLAQVSLSTAKSMLKNLTLM
jgi:hypothetical protein